MLSGSGKHGLIRPILAGMRQRSFVLEHLAKVAHVDPTAAHRTLNEMPGFVLRLLANALPDDFAALNRHAPDIGAAPTS
jgi:hypothetical protein